jgi:hypothetical protein
LKAKHPNRFEARIYRLNPASHIETYTGWYFFDAALDNPIHHSYVLREPAAGRLKSGSNTDLSVKGALCVILTAAIKAASTRDVVEHYHSIPNFVSIDALPNFGDDASDLMPVNSRRRQEIMFDFFEISVANTASFDTYKQLPEIQLRSGYLFDRNSARTPINGSPH